MECRLAGETKVLEGNLLQRHFCPSQNSTWPDACLNPGRRGGKPATNCLSYGAAFQCWNSVRRFTNCLWLSYYEDKSEFHDSGPLTQDNNFFMKLRICMHRQTIKY
jgi:hypothetical protein